MSLQIDNLSAGYGKRTVLEHLSLEPLAAGSFIGVIGPNASGKSTLFKAIAGLLKATTGSIVLHGGELSRATRKVRSRLIAYMPQAYGCNALLSVFESVLLALKQHGAWRVSAADIERTSNMLTNLNLQHLATRGIAELSGGQAQMVALAQTLVREPQVILLDEPTSALDLHHQLAIMAAIRQEMHRCASQNTTQDSRQGLNQGAAPVVIAALHDLNLAAKFCDRLILLSQGTVLADGPPAHILALPELATTYKVETSLEKTRRGGLYIDADLPARG